MNFWEFIGFVFWGYIIFAFLGMLIGLFFDVFRDSSLSGWAKAGWALLLVVLPIVGALVYLIARGGSMSDRQRELAQGARVQQEDYIRSVASSSPADDIAKAKTLLDAGSITREEYEALKSRALGRTTTRASVS